MLRPELRNLASQSPLGPESAWDEESLEQLSAEIEAVSPPLAAEEAAALLPLLDRPYDDSIYGLLWAVLHLIESFGEAGRTRPAPDSDAPMAGPAPRSLAERTGSLDVVAPHWCAPTRRNGAWLCGQPLDADPPGRWPRLPPQVDAYLVPNT